GRAPDAPLDLRARALRDLGGSTEVSGNWQGAATYYDESLELFTGLRDERAILRLRHRVLNTLIYSGQYDAARYHAQDSLERARRGGFGYEESDLLQALGVLEYYAGNLEAACEFGRRSLDLGRKFGSWPWGETVKLSNLARFSNALGRTEDAEAYGREGLQLS